MSFFHSIQAAFRAHGDRPALLHHDRRWTYRQLDDDARAGAGWLQSLGVRPGDRVVLCTGDKPAFVRAHLAALYAGAVSLPLNPRFTREELRFFLSDSGAKVALVGSEAEPIIASLRAELPDLQHVAAQVESAPGYQSPDLASDDPALILYSSGTTGWPKGVVHTHANVASSLHALQECWRLTCQDVVLNVLPLFHIHGLCFATQLTLMTGACLILDDFDVRRTLARIAECTVFMAVPTIYYRFLEEANFAERAKAWAGVRLFTCGSAPIRAEVLPGLEAILGKPVINRYGMTEGFVITSLPLAGPWPWGSVGTALPGVEVRIWADDRLAPANEVGAVQLRGPNLFRAYWKKPEATQAAFASGWFETGDLGFQDDAGFLTLVGRKNDLIITSGFNVYPQVVERVLNECPGVRESAVVGVPDARRGERVVAFVVRADAELSEQRLSEFWQERLVDYQRPKEVFFVEALPRNALGKVLRRELQEAAKKDL